MKEREKECAYERKKAAMTTKRQRLYIRFQYNHVNPDPKIVRFAVVFHYNNRCVLCIMWFEYFFFIYLYQWKSRHRF